MPNSHELVALYLKVLRGWNDRSAKSMAECFADEGVLIGFDGSLVAGRRAIEEHLDTIFADHPTPAFVAIVRATREIGGVGIVRADVGMVPPGQSGINPAANARQTLVAREVDGGWKSELFQNTPAALHWDDEGRERLSAELDAAFKERGPLPDA
ncbi:SgcJ/EcaC family oxidoreductase [Mesorhizobium xinjiangense]|uniref:SgcJ/EcaC family oxidoreductase n=1 Tax=Mesorhizobium xinjiangense TaxID=2678685 RepID=UPI0018DE178D|nr:SgcJ/EcaC family oxidoreductase [Mesorhizobium xinjiangense]